MGGLVLYDANPTVRAMLARAFGGMGLDVVSVGVPEDIERAVESGADWLVADLSRCPELLMVLQTVVPRHIPANHCVVTTVRPTDLAPYMPHPVGVCFFGHVVQRPFRRTDFLRFWEDIAKPSVGRGSQEGVVNTSLEQIFEAHREDVPRGADAPVMRCENRLSRRNRGRATADAEGSPDGIARKEGNAPLPAVNAGVPERRVPEVAPLPAVNASVPERRVPDVAPLEIRPAGIVRRGSSDALPVVNAIVPEMKATEVSVPLPKPLPPKLPTATDLPKANAVILPALPRADAVIMPALPKANAVILPAIPKPKPVIPEAQPLPGDAPSLAPLSDAPDESTPEDSESLEKPVLPPPSPASLDAGCTMRFPAQAVDSSLPPKTTVMSAEEIAAAGAFPAPRIFASAAPDTVDDDEAKPAPRKAPNLVEDMQSEFVVSHTNAVPDLPVIEDDDDVTHEVAASPMVSGLPPCIDNPASEMHAVFRFAWTMAMVRMSMVFGLAYTIVATRATQHFVMCIRSGYVCWVEIVSDGKVPSAEEYLAGAALSDEALHREIADAVRMGEPMSVAFSSRGKDDVAAALVERQIRACLSTMRIFEGYPADLYRDIPSQWKAFRDQRPFHDVQAFPIFFDDLRNRVETAVPPESFTRMRFAMRPYRMPLNASIILNHDERILSTVLRTPRTIAELKTLGLKQVANTLFRLLLFEFVDFVD